MDRANYQQITKKQFIPSNVYSTSQRNLQKTHLTELGDYTI
jgi:hypothetical protein